MHDGIVRASVAEGLLINDTPSRSPGAIDVVLLRLAGSPQWGFLVATGSKSTDLTLQPDRLKAPVLSCRMRRQGDEFTAVLRHPLVDRYVAAIPEGYGLSLPLLANRADVGAWEVFRLIRHETASKLPPSVAAALETIRPALAEHLSICSVLAWLHQATVEDLVCVGQALLALLPRESMDAVGRAVAEQPTLARRIGTAWPDNPFTAAVIPNLAEWHRARSLRTTIEVGTDLDMLATAVGVGQPVGDLAIHLLAASRRTIAPTRGIAIVATARNEGPFFLDWIAHHRALGVEHFFIYSSDDNDDQSDDLLLALAEHGIITYLHNSVSPSGNRQRKAYNHAFLCLPELLDFRWTATIDLDEYLMVDPTRFASLIDFVELQESRGADAVALNWLMYGPDRQPVFRDRPFSQRLLRRRVQPNRHVKTIVRTNQPWGTLHHAPIWPDRVTGLALDSLGKPHYSPGLIGGIGAFRDAPDVGPAWVNHYFLRSLPEIVLKYARSSADAGGTHELRFNPNFVSGLLEDMQLPLVEDHTISAWSDAVAAECRTLRALPGIADAHAASVASFCAAANRLIRDIPNHAAELPDHVREHYLALVNESIELGVASP